MAIITKSNLLNQLPNLNKLKSSMDNIEFKVCFDMFMTDTAKACDMFIPTTSTLESEDLIYSSMTNPYITYNEKALEPKNIYMDEYYFFMELAKREYLTKIIEPLKDYYEDISLDKIKDEYITIHKSVAWEDKKFLTTSGKFEISLCKDSLLYNDEEKIRLLTNHGRDSLSSQHFMDIEGISNAYINRRLALKKGIYDNEVVNLKSENGSIKVKINIDESVGDNIVMMYVGWWDKHGNPNMLTSSGISDIGGQVTYNETFVDIEKCI